MDKGDRFQRIARLFEHARNLTPDERNSYLREACADDISLMKEVETLLIQHDATNNPFDRPAPGPKLLDQIRSACAANDPVPERIGPYKILGVLGRGGMGVVYRAQQENPRRDVAVKVIRSDGWRRELLKRFELEAAVLGHLQHPGIAQIYEAGVYGAVDAQSPYLAMEYVSGQPLDEYVRRSKPSLSERLDLFLQICDAVQHAHQKGVIHRDLKPANIFVVTADPSSSPSDTHLEELRRPIVKVLDFGVARATDADLQITSLHTNVGELVGTLPYMSPEQVTGRSHDVDTRSDVYALGVILYELLADRLPFDLRHQAIVAAAKVISEEEPAPLTDVSSTYRGDLNTITLKALEKEPERRYASASDLAADAQRYLDNQPIVARPASAMYQISKFAARNKGLVVGIASALLILVMGIIASSIFAVGQMRARQDADRQRSIAQAVNEFLNRDLLAKANPYASNEKEPSVRSLLDKASGSIDKQFIDQPDVAVQLHRTIGYSYFGLGRHDQALDHLRRAKSLCEEKFPIGDERTIKARAILTERLVMLRKLDEAELMAFENVELAAKYIGTDDPWTARPHGHLAILLKRRGRLAEAEEHYRRALEILKPHGESVAKERLVFSGNLALLLTAQRRYDEAETVLREVIAGWTKLLGRRHLESAYGMMNLGDALWHQSKRNDLDAETAKEKVDEAESLFVEALEIRSELLGDEHAHTAMAHYAIGLIHSSRGEFSKAERRQRETLALRRRIYGTDEEPYVLESMNSIATALRKQGKFAEAAEMSRAALETAERAFGFEHASAKLNRNGLLESLWRMSSVNEIQKCVERYRGSLRDEELAHIFSRLAWAHFENDDLENAIKTQREAIDLLPKVHPAVQRWQQKMAEWEDSDTLLPRK